MSTFVRGNKDLIKAINRNLILNTVRRHGALSRTQITEISRLSVGAVSQITNELLNDEWLLEGGEGDYTGGAAADAAAAQPGGRVRCRRQADGAAHRLRRDRPRIARPPLF
ncbi:MAG: winged helix-turn-helix transcriptional regulator [Chloroflexi bacterium]|nr:winged helix-turn-helix transcriptional regulator [Chloroflexota bacterium]